MAVLIVSDTHWAHFPPIDVENEIGWQLISMESVRPQSLTMIPVGDKLSVEICLTHSCEWPVPRSNRKFNRIGFNNQKACPTMTLYYQTEPKSEPKASKGIKVKYGQNDWVRLVSQA